MTIEYSKLKGVKIFTPTVYKDDRGFFLESFNGKIEDELQVQFVQDNHSCSKKGVIRGLHYQWKPAVGKLVRVVKGSGIDVVVDLRLNSSTYGEHEMFTISEDDKKIIWVPEGFAHGFLSLEDDTHLVYKVTGRHNSEAEGSLNPLCSILDIKWPIPHELIILSTKDSTAKSFLEYKRQPIF